MYRKGISPVIATVIIVAVAVAISIAVVGWLMGLWSSVAGGTEMLQITPVNLTATVEDSNEVTYAYFYVINKGTVPVKIIRVDVIGVGSSELDTNVEANNTAVLIRAEITGEKCTAGVSYIVKIYTGSGNVYQTSMMCFEKEQGQ